MGSQVTRAIAPVTDDMEAVHLRVGSGDHVVLVDRPLTLGSSDKCDVVVEDRTVSRRHLEVRPCATGVRIVDQDSRNGTWSVAKGGSRESSAVRLYDAELELGQSFQVGETVITVENADASNSVAPGNPGDTSPVDDEEITSFGRFVGSARVLRPLYKELRRLARSDLAVLLEGESGAGKELLAEGLHEQGARSKGPFVVVDCGALPENLIESELFGHVKGSFTGAMRDRIGAFEQAHGGTVFLDEIGELPLTMQTRLLRVLDRKQVRRVGSEKVVDVDVRVVSATNRNLEKEIEQSRFRLDLFHRLGGSVVRIPPLRERRGDVEMLARLFLKNFGLDDASLTEEVLGRMGTHLWPGNVRELRNYVERLALLGESGFVEGPDRLRTLDELARSELPFRNARAQALEAFTESYVGHMLEKHDGNVTDAARAAGVARRHFQRLRSQGEGDSPEPTPGSPEDID